MTDKEIIEFAAEFREGILDGGPSFLMCFAICAPLATLLGMCGVPNEMVEGLVENMSGDGCNHFWLRLSDGRVLDPTADQFNDVGFPPMPPVYLGQPATIHRPIKTRPPTAAAVDGL